jgi:hypothetical protein
VKCDSKVLAGYTAGNSGPTVQSLIAVTSS